MTRHALRYFLLPGRFAICRLPPGSPLPEWALDNDRFHSVSRSPQELSIVSPEERVPSGITAESGWICLQLEGPFPLSQTGVLSSFIQPLADHAIPMLAISTFDTDYVLLKEEFRKAALECLRTAGHQLITESP